MITERHLARMGGVAAVIGSVVVGRSSSAR